MASAHIKIQRDDIIKSPEDKRLYRALELNNGLKVLLVSDPTTDKSSAAMDIHIGTILHLYIPIYKWKLSLRSIYLWITHTLPLQFSFRSHV